MLGYEERLFYDVSYCNTQYRFMIIHQRPSPNYNLRPSHAVMSTIVMHYTDMESASEAIDLLCHEDAGVSAHYLIDENGEVTQMVADDHRAWHAGKSTWRGIENVNDYSIGIELANPGHRCGYKPFPKAQMESLKTLCCDLIERHPIEQRNIVAHSDIAPLRKKDPGELFDWQWLAEQGIGLWPESLFEAELLSIKALQQTLSDIGYPLVIDGIMGEETEAVITAFKRRFVQNDVSAKWSLAANSMALALQRAIA